VNAAPEIFHQYRSKLIGIAYRMLGSRADAEDVLQEAYIRWLTAEVSDFRSPEAWLVTVVTRLSIDRLRLAKKERETYVGHWIPEPWVREGEHLPEHGIELAGDISIAFLMVLERLAPDERAAFLLHEVFEVGYPEIAQMLGKSLEACRQIVHRARVRVRQDRPRFEVNRESHLRLLEKFIEAARTGDCEQMMSLLGEDVTFTGDGGGRLPSITKVLRGARGVTRFYRGIRKMYPGRMEYRIAEINGMPGLLRYLDGELESATSMLTDGMHILDIYVVRNPDKLRLIGLRSI
jgi:RNA polymerase sigma-70 factor (ECF subfamily)